MIEQNVDSDSAGIFAKSVCLIFSTGRPRTRRKLSVDMVDAGDADKSMLHLGKEIMDSMELRAVGKLDNLARAYVRAKSLPSPLRGGAYFVPMVSVEAVDAALAKMLEERKGLIDAFIAAYPKLVLAAKERLGHCFNYKDYPDEQSVRDSFTWETRYVTFATPSSLRNISKEFFERESAKAAAQWAEASEEIRQALRAEMAGLVSHLAERLDTDKDGEAKIFHKSAIEKLSAFLDELPKRSIVDDAELTKLAEQARGILAGLDAGSLRKSQDLRSTVKSGFDALKASLDTMVVDKPKRFITFEDTSLPVDADTTGEASMFMNSVAGELEKTPLAEA